MKHYKIRQAITDRSSESVDLYLKDIKKYPLLTDDEEKELFKDIKNERNREKLIQSNLRFVVSIAKQYQGKGIDFADLIAVGNTGLLQALDKYNPEVGCKFISYAVWWIRQAILEEIMLHGKTVRVPINKVALNIKIMKAATEFEQKYGIPPTDDELSELLNLPLETIEQCNKNNVVIINDSIVSPEGDEESFLEMLPSEEKMESDNDDIKLIIRTALNQLNPMEQIVLKNYFGFDTEPKELKTIAEQNDITVERVRQIKDKAIIKLRKSEYIEPLMKQLGQI